MKNLKFDDRYPAMFQPGGSGHDADEPGPVRFLPVAGVPVKAVPLDPVSARWDPVLPASGLPTEEIAESDGLDPVNPHERLTRWSGLAWPAGIAAALVCVATGIFCLTALSFIPASRTATSENFQEMSVNPWGFLLLPIALPLMLSGMGMLAALLLLGSRQYPQHSRAMRAGMALIGAGALVGAYCAFFYQLIFPDDGTAMIDPADGWMPIPWSYVFYDGKRSLACFALIVLTVLVVVRPGTGRLGTTLSGRLAMLAGSVLLAGAGFALFAQQMFPFSMGMKTVTEGQMTYQTIPWPQLLMEAGGPLALVGVGSLLWGALIFLTSRAAHDSMLLWQEPDSEDGAHGQ